MQLDTHNQMADNFLTLDQITTNPYRRSQEQVSSFYNPSSQLASPIKTRDYSQDFDTNTMKFKLVEHQQLQEQSLMNKYINSNIMNQHTKKFLSPSDSPIKQTNRQRFMSPQVRNYTSMPFEEQSKFGNNIKQELEFSDNNNNIHNIQNNLHSYQVSNSISDLQSQNIYPQVEKVLTTYPKQDYQFSKKINEDFNNQYGLRKVLSSDSLFTKKINESENHQTTSINNFGGFSSRNQTGLNNIYSSHSNFLNLSKDNTNYHSSWNHNTYQLSNFAKEKSQFSDQSNYTAITNTTLTKHESEPLARHEEKSDETENVVIASKGPPLRFSYQQSKQNPESTFYEHTKSNSIFTGFISNSKVETPTNLGGYTPLSLQTKQSYDFDHNYSTRQSQQYNQINSGYSNTTSNTPTNKETNSQLANRFNQIKKQIEDNRNMQEQFNTQPYNHSLPSQRQNYQKSSYEHLSTLETYDPKSSKLPLTGSYLNSTNASLTNTNYTRSNYAKHQTYNHLSSSKNLEEYSAYSNGTTNTNLPKNDSLNEIPDQRYSLQKFDKYPYNYNLQTDKIRSVSPDNQHITKLQKHNSLQIQKYTENEQQQTKTQTNQDAYQNIYSQFKTESDDQFNKYIQQENQNTSNSGLYGSGQFNLGFKFNTGIQNDKTSIYSNTNTFTIKGNNLKDSTDKNSPINSPTGINSYNSGYYKKDYTQSAFSNDQEVFRASQSRQNSDKNQYMSIKDYISLAKDNENKLGYGSSQDASPNNSDTQDSKNPKISDDLIVEQLEQIQTKQHDFNAKKLSDRMQSFMFLCKENTYKIQEVLGLKQFSTQYSSATSQNKTQYQPISSNNVQQNQLYTQQQNNDTKTVTSINNQLTQPIQNTNILQGLSRVAYNPLQRANSPVHHHKHSLTPQHNTISTHRFLSPCNNQKFQGSIQNPKPLSQFSDVAAQLGSQLSLGYQTQHQTIYQPSQSITNNIQNTITNTIPNQQLINNQQVILIPQQQQQQKVYYQNDLNMNQVYSPSSILNQHQRLNSINNYSNIPQQKIITNSLNMNNKVGSPSGLQMNTHLDFSSSVQAYNPVILNQQQVLYCKKI